jgi:hypothetical protein
MKPSDTPARSRDRLPVGVQRLTSHAGLAIAILACVLGLELFGDFVTDDASISLRYARNLADGHGLRWNIGEDPVEGYSNFLHVLLGALALKLGLPALAVLRLLNQAAILGVVAVVFDLAHRRLGSRRWATAAAVLVALHPPLFYWGSSGLETGLYTLLVCSCLYVVGDGTRPRTIWTALPFLLAALARPEGAVAFVAVMGIGLASDAVRRRPDFLRRHWRWAVLFLVLYGAYVGWRISYFGHLLPNSVYYKADAAENLILVREFASQNLLLLLALPLAPWRRLGSTGLVMLALVVAHLVGYHDVRPSVSGYHRYFLPILPFLAIIAASSLHRLSAVRGGSRVAGLLAVAGFATLLAFDLGNSESGTRTVRAKLERMNTRMQSRIQVARIIARVLPADATVAIGDVGAVGYILPNPILDAFGLNSEAFVHEHKRSRRRYVKSLRAREPDAIVVVSRKRGRWKRRYKTGDYLRAGDDFPARYVKLATIASPAEAYHYWVFARRELVGDRPNVGAVDVDDDIAAAIDRGARQIRAGS